MRVQLYRDMLRLRIVEETIAARYSEWEMRCPTHLSVGQEGVAVGVCAALEQRDYAFGGHRAHAHYLAKGGDLNAMIAELHGKETGCAAGKGGSMHLIDVQAGFLGAVPIVGSTIPIAVGAAFGAKLAGEDRVTVGFFGDGATEEGVFSESLNFASLDQLPVVFVCENNLYSVYTRLEARQPAARDLRLIAEGHGVPYAKGDGNDPEGVYAATREAVERARAGQGPTLLEFSTYRWREHCGPFYDDDLGYRPDGELAAMQAACCVTRLERALLADGTLTPERVEALKQELQGEVDAAFVFAKESAFPPRERLHEHVFSTPLQGSTS